MFRSINTLRLIRSTATRVVQCSRITIRRYGCDFCGSQLLRLYIIPTPRAGQNGKLAMAASSILSDYMEFRKSE